MEKDNLLDVTPLQNYFGFDSGSETNVFDQLTSANSSSNIVVSKSSQEVFNSADNKKPVDLPDIASINLDAIESEPAVCKMFSQKPTSPTFFDLISPLSDKSGLIIDSTNIINSNKLPFVDVMERNKGSNPSPLQGFEDMSDGLNGTENDRSREAWIPSDQTRQALIRAATSSPGTYNPDKELLTRPGTVLEEEMVDNVNLLMKQYLPENELNNRKILTVVDVSQDERGLRELIQAECYRAAVNLTGRLLNLYGQGYNKQGQPSKHTVYTIQLWFTRFCLLFKLNAFQVADSEAKPWWNFDKPDLYYQFYPELYGGKLGTMVPFQMRLLLASLPAYLKNHLVAINRLYSILKTVKDILLNLKNGKSEDGSLIELSQKEREISIQIWSSREARVYHSIINVALMSKQFKLAIDVLKKLSDKTISPNQKRALESSLGRIYLEVGDITNAEKCFSISNSLKPNQKNTLSTTTADLQELIDQGLIHVAQNCYKEAFDCFQKASILDPLNIMVLNNMAVCLLYLGQLKNALTILTSAIESNPRLALHEALILNVCTLFELESSHCDQNKLALLRQVAKYRGDAFNINCFKLPFK